MYQNHNREFSSAYVYGKQDHQLFSIHLTRSELKEVATSMHLEDMRSTSWDQQKDFYNIESGEQLLI